MAIDTKSARRRSLNLQSLEDVLAELDRIEAAMAVGEATTSGNWTIGEICDHCAKLIRFACDGFPTLAPAPLRFIFRVCFLKRAMGPDPIPSGFKLSRQASAMLPTPGITDSEGISELRKEIKRLIAGKPMYKPSPVFGRITHEQWLTIQLKHLDLHLGFIHPGNVPSHAAV